MSNTERSEKTKRWYRQYHPDAGPDVYVPDVVGIADAVFPDFRTLGHEYFFADVMSRPGLTMRERNIVVLGVLQALQFSGTKGHMQYALHIGTTRETVLAVLMHVAPLAGWPVGAEFFDLIDEVYPGFLKGNKEQILEDIRSRNLLSERERSMATMGALLARRFYGRLKAEMRRALDIGIAREGVLEVILQATPFAGWPAGVGGLYVAREAFAPQNRG